MNRYIEEIWEAEFRGKVIRMAVLKEFPDYVIYKCGLIYDYKDIFEDPYDLRNKIKIIKFQESSYGYPKVNLRTQNSSRKSVSVHRLMAMAFIDNPENKKQINHINGNKNDFSISNLEWVTPKQNIKHSIETGLRDNKTSLSLEDVIEIKKRLEQGESGTSIKTSYPVSVENIYRIKNGHTWAHIALS